MVIPQEEDIAATVVRTIGGFAQFVDMSNKVNLGCDFPDGTFFVGHLIDEIGHAEGNSVVNKKVLSFAEADDSSVVVATVD